MTVGMLSQKLENGPPYSWLPKAYVHTRPARRMWELIDTVREDRCMGLVSGRPGVGKSVTAKRYVAWKDWEDNYRRVLPDSWVSHKGVVYGSARSTTTPEGFLKMLCGLLGREVRPGARREEVDRTWQSLTSEKVETILVDEADRLSDECLEIARDLFDNADVCIIFMGMAGLERRLQKLPQLYSRIGFYYEYPALTEGQTQDFLSRAKTDWRQSIAGEPSWDLPAPWTDKERAAIRVAHRLTGGIPRKLQRLMRQVDRLLKLNRVREMNPQLVRDAARLLFLGNVRKSPQVSAQV